MCVCVCVLLVVVLPSAEKQLLYSIAQADWAIPFMVQIDLFKNNSYSIEPCATAPKQTNNNNNNNNNYKTPNKTKESKTKQNKQMNKQNQ